MKAILITGAAAFIGSNLAKRILCREQGLRVIGIDSMTNYYDVDLKENSLWELEGSEFFTFVRGSIADKPLVGEVFLKHQPHIVVNMAMHAYSKLYGIPSTGLRFFAATKKSNELMAHAYSKLYHIPVTGLRFFTVYGPFGRPDMAYFKFTNKMVNGEKIQIYNYGDMKRDFTYIDDIVTGVMKVMDRPPVENSRGVRYKVYNIGNHKPEDLLFFVETLEQCLIKEGVIEQPAEKEFLPMQPGDVYQTYADTKELEQDFGFCPDTPLKEGLARFAKWYREYYMGKKGRV